MIKGLVCLVPLRGGKVEAKKQGNKYFPMEKAWCLKPTSDRRDHISSSWEGIVDCLLWTCLLLMPQRAGGSQNVFSWEWEDQRLLFAFPKPKTPKQKLKTIEVVFIYSKRSTGFWYCERFQGPGKTSGTKNCDQNLFSFLLFKYFSKFIKILRKD